MKGKIWTRDEWYALGELGSGGELGPWAFDLAKQTGRSIGALDAIFRIMRNYGLVAEDIRAALTANVIDKYDAIGICAQVRAWLDIPEPAPDIEPEPEPERHSGTASALREIDYTLNQFSQRLHALDAHLAALGEDIETLTNGMREWRKEEVAHYTTIKEKVSYQTGQMTALMRSFGVKPEHGGASHPQHATGD